MISSRLSYTELLEPRTKAKRCADDAHFAKLNIIFYRSIEILSFVFPVSLWPCLLALSLFASCSFPDPSCLYLPLFQFLHLMKNAINLYLNVMPAHREWLVTYHIALRIAPRTNCSEGSAIHIFGEPD